MCLIIKFSKSHLWSVCTQVLKKPHYPANRDLKQEEAVKKTQRSTGKFPFKWYRGLLNFNSLAAAAPGKFVTGDPDLKR